MGKVVVSKKMDCPDLTCTQGIKKGAMGIRVCQAFMEMTIIAQSRPVVLIILSYSQCVCVFVCIYSIAHNRAIRPCHPIESHFIPLKGGSTILLTKTSINDHTRQRGHILSTCTVLILTSWVFCALCVCVCMCIH